MLTYVKHSCMMFANIYSMSNFYLFMPAYGDKSKSTYTLTCLAPGGGEEHTAGSDHDIRGLDHWGGGGLMKGRIIQRRSH